MLFMAGSGGEAAALDLRVAIDEIDAALAGMQSEPAPGVPWDRNSASALLADAEQNGGYTHSQLLDALEACVRPAFAQAAVDVEYGWTAQEWRDWSLNLSAMLSDEWDGDEDELSIVEDFVRHFAKQSRSPHPGLDRTELRSALVEVIDGEYEGNESDGQIADRMIAVFDRLAPKPAPASGTIDRGALLTMLLHGRAEAPGLRSRDAQALTDRILALVRPAEGVWLGLAHDDLLTIAVAVRESTDNPAMGYSHRQHLLALAERLEAAS